MRGEAVDVGSDSCADGKEALETATVGVVVEDLLTAMRRGRQVSSGSVSGRCSEASVLTLLRWAWRGPELSPQMESVQAGQTK